MASRSARTSRPRPARTQQDARDRLASRVADLEDRLTLLEARLRRTVVALKEAGAPKKPLEVLGHKDRPRCPGCKLEVPKGRRGDACVWCGFRFDAVPPRRLGARKRT